MYFKRHLFKKKVISESIWNTTKLFLSLVYLYYIPCFIIWKRSVMVRATGNRHVWYKKMPFLFFFFIYTHTHTLFWSNRINWYIARIYKFQMFLHASMKMIFSANPLFARFQMASYDFHSLWCHRERTIIRFGRIVSSLWDTLFWFYFASIYIVEVKYLSL